MMLMCTRIKYDIFRNLVFYIFGFKYLYFNIFLYAELEELY